MLITGPGVVNWCHTVHDMKHEKILVCKQQTKMVYLIILTDDCTNNNNSVN